MRRRCVGGASEAGRAQGTGRARGGGGAHVVAGRVQSEAAVVVAGFAAARDAAREQREQVRGYGEETGARAGGVCEGAWRGTLERYLAAAELV